ncbi:hypothetical protein [Rosistilla oblonga]|uniref:hypothetical protein n=1 Tax=Rosistilla oblonga TaxID=2527990 RepID=UPI003A973116
MSNREMPAFPVPGPQDDEDFNGMALRDWFAGQALTGVMNGIHHPHNHPDLVADLSYHMADAMLKAREVQP